MSGPRAGFFASRETRAACYLSARLTCKTLARRSSLRFLRGAVLPRTFPAPLGSPSRLTTVAFLALSRPFAFFLFRHMPLTDTCSCLCALLGTFLLPGPYSLSLPTPLPPPLSLSLSLLHYAPRCERCAHLRKHARASLRAREKN